MDEQKLPFTVSVTLLLTWRACFCAIWGRQPLLHTERQGCWQGLRLITKIGSSEDIYNGIDKIALPRCFVCNHRVPMSVANISAHFDEMVENYVHLHFHVSMHVRRHTGCHGYKMAPVVAARARRWSVCRRLLRLSRKICLMFPAATVFNLGENQFIYVSETHIKLNIGRFSARFCVAMARLRRILTSAASQSM